MRGLFVILFCFANVALAGAKTNSLEYIVRFGDTLLGIARKYRTSYEHLCALNNKPTYWSFIKIGQTIIVPEVKPQFSSEQLALLWPVCQEAPMNAELLNEYGDQALFVGETAADVAHNKAGREGDFRNTLFLRRRRMDGTDEWRILLTTGSAWRPASGMGRWQDMQESSLKGCFNVRSASFSLDGRHLWLICDTHIPVWLVACSYDVQNRVFRVLTDGSAIDEQPDGTIIVRDKKTYLDDENGESLGARWRDIWMTLDGKIIRRGKLMTCEDVLAR